MEIEEMVAEEILRRRQMGLKKYGRTLRQNPAAQLERLQHAFEEAMDLCVYLKWEIERTKEETQWDEEINLFDLGGGDEGEAKK